MFLKKWHCHDDDDDDGASSHAQIRARLVLKLRFLFFESRLAVMSRHRSVSRARSWLCDGQMWHPAGHGDDDRFDPLGHDDITTVTADDNGANADVNAADCNDAHDNRDTVDVNAACIDVDARVSSAWSDLPLDDEQRERHRGNKIGIAQPEAPSINDADTAQGASSSADDRSITTVFKPYAVALISCGRTDHHSSHIYDMSRANASWFWWNIENDIGPVRAPHEQNGTYPITMRAVIGQSKFTELVQSIFAWAMEKFIWLGGGCLAIECKYGAHESDVIVRCLQGMLNRVRAPSGDRVFNTQVFALNEFVERTGGTMPLAMVQEAFTWTTTPWGLVECSEQLYAAEEVWQCRYAYANFEKLMAFERENVDCAKPILERKIQWLVDDGIGELIRETRDVDIDGRDDRFPCSKLSTCPAT